MTQDDSDWEIVVVDDASRADLRAVTEAFGDERIRYLRQSRNQGTSAARNRGVHEARGTWIVFLDSDDELTPGALASIREATGSGHAFLYGRCIRPDGTSTVPDETVHGPVTLRQYMRDFMRGEYLPVVRRDVALRYPFEEDIRSGDGITQMRIARGGHDLFVADAVWRIYHDSGVESLSFKPRHYDRYAATFRRDLAINGVAYLRHYPPRFFKALLRAVAYQALAWRTRYLRSSKQTSPPIGK